MVTINFKGEVHPKHKNLVKLTMIFFRTGYNRVPKVLDISGQFKDWDQDAQLFKSKTSESQSKNKQLADLAEKYLQKAEEWEQQGIEWSARQWSHCFDNVKTEEKKEKVKILTVSQCVDKIIQDLKERKRLKNGVLKTSTNTAECYKYFGHTLIDFTKDVYNRSFSSYYFNEIDEKFIIEYVHYIQERGAKNGNNGGVYQRLSTFKGLFYYSNKMGMPHTDKSILKCVKLHMKREDSTPQTIPYTVITQIEKMDRAEFSLKEQFYIDLFLFSFYIGGMAPVDVCSLTWNGLNEDILEWERIKFPKKAKIPLNNRAKQIILKYQSQCYGNYVLPVFSHKHDTEAKQTGRLKRIRAKVNTVLKKVCSKLQIQDTFTWYAARGTFITKMIDEGYHPVAVAGFSGNSPKTIYKHYFKQTNNEDILVDMNQMFTTP